MMVSNDYVTCLMVMEQGSVMMCLAEAHNRTEVGFEQPTFHSVLIKFSQKASVFTVIIMFSIKSYDLDVYWTEAIIIHIHNI